jgi:hypothetical protein
MRSRLRPLAPLLAVALGCAGSTAIVSRPTGPPVEGEIAGSDASRLYLRAENGRLVTLDQSRVADVDHPGNVWADIGLGYAGGSAVFFLLPGLLIKEPPHTPDNGTAILTYGGLLGVAMGLSVFAYAFERARPPGWLLPPAAPGDPVPLGQLLPGPVPDDYGRGESPLPTFHR